MRAETKPEKERMMEHKVYVFATEAAAEAFKMTAYHLGYDETFAKEYKVKRIGSALVMTELAYLFVLNNTYATPASIVAKEETD